MLEPSRISVDLRGRTYRFAGSTGAVATALGAALAENGAQPVEVAADLLIVSRSLLPVASDDDADYPLRDVAAEGRAMVGRGGGRIVFLLSALAGLPMRRHVDYSVDMAAAMAGMRGLAMQLAPTVLVNAVGAGVIEDESGTLLAGDRNMLTHASLGRPGGLADLTNAVLFLCDPLNSYTTGQLLTVDGGWSTGYGRNF